MQESGALLIVCSFLGVAVRFHLTAECSAPDRQVRDVEHGKKGRNSLEFSSVPLQQRIPGGDSFYRGNFCVKF